MPEIEETRRLTRAEVADYLREFADQLDDGDGDSDPRSADRYEGPDDGGNDIYEEGDGGTNASGAADARVTILVGNDSATVNPTEEVTFGVRVGGNDPLVGGVAERYVTFDLTWDADQVDDGPLDIK